MNPINLTSLINESPANLTHPCLIKHEFISLNYNAYIIGNAVLTLWAVIAQRYDKTLRNPVLALAVFNWIMLGFQFIMIPINNWSII